MGRGGGVRGGIVAQTFDASGTGLTSFSMKV